MTPGARRVLQKLADDDDCDLVREGLSAYCGDDRTTSRVVNELLSLTAISVSWAEGIKATYYTINDTGRALLRRPELENEIVTAFTDPSRKPFSIIDDKIVLI